jgi:hypothetical protein
MTTCGELSRAHVSSNWERSSAAKVGLTEPRHMRMTGRHRISTVYHAGMATFTGKLAQLRLGFRPITILARAASPDL